MSKEQLIDLDRHQLDLVEEIVKRHIPRKAVWAYGSRVTWKANEISDLDLVVFDCDTAVIMELKEAFEENDLLISVDVMDWENIPENFKENIKKKYVVLQEKTEFPGWREVILTEVTNKIGDGLHGTPSYDETGEYFFINGNNLVDGKIAIKPETKKVNKLEYEKHKKDLSDRTILISINGTIGNVAIYNKEKCLLGKSACYININDNVIRPFLYYVFLNKDFQHYIKETATGTTIPNVPLKGIRQFAFQLPPLLEQKTIAEILSSLDDKIDLLHRQNKTLENIAQTLFRQWFVEEADEGWAEKPLGETVDISIGRTPPRKEFQWFSKKQGDWKWISIKDMAGNGTYIFDTSEYLTKEAVDKFNIPVIPSNTVILSFKMTIGRVCITTEDMLSNEAIASFKFRSDTPYSKTYLYFYLKNFKFESWGSTSSIVTSINTGMIKSFTITIPKRKRIDKFTKIAGHIFRKIYCNQVQIRGLISLRDTLLPKLMSGVARVKSQ